VLPAGFSCALLTPPTTPLAAATHALTLLIEQRLMVEVAHLADRADIIVLPPLCPVSVIPIDFGAADDLMAGAQQTTGKWIDAGRHRLPHPERFLGMHGHRWAAPCPHDHDVARDFSAPSIYKEIA
jgi:NTE family protein